MTKSYDNNFSTAEKITYPHFLVTMIMLVCMVMFWSIIIFDDDITYQYKLICETTMMIAMLIMRREMMKMKRYDMIREGWYMEELCHYYNIIYNLYYRKRGDDDIG